jgi:CRISPR-associated protein Csb2
VIGLSFEFLTGRYHATGWDHHVNEGTVEWPPAPWRILRALVAASYRAGVAEADARALVARLSEVLPHYWLVRGSVGHTRHYMPTAGTTTKVIDAFVAVGGAKTGPGEPDLVVGWEVDLTTAQREALSRLVRHIPYLGRAESWVHVALSETPTQWRGLRAVPDEQGLASDTASLLASATSAEHATWLAMQAAGGKGRKAISLPRDVWEALHADTGVLAQQGWSGPPGARWVRYRFDHNPFPPPPGAPRLSIPLPTVAIFAIRSPAPLHVDRTLFVAERFRTALLGRARELLPGPSPEVLCGHGEDHQPLRGHGHAAYLPVADSRGFIDRIVVHARAGFGKDVQRVLSALRVLGRSSDAPRVALIALGGPELGAAAAVLGTSRVWETATPFVPPRHLKYRRGAATHPIDEQVRLLCRDLGLPEPSVEPGPSGLALEGQELPLPWYRFKRDRFRGGGARGSRSPYSLRLTFPNDVDGPIALGFAAHFGLGQFRPV